METNINVGHLIYAVALLVAVLFMGRGIFRNGSQAARNAAIWAAIFAVGMLVYVAKDEILLRLVPSEPRLNELGQIVLHRAEGGHFYVNADVSGVSIRFLVDTGASRVVLSPKDAKRIGVIQSALSFDQRVNTANGEAWSAHYTIEAMEIEGIEFSAIRASVNQVDMKNSLLGMTFLDMLQSYTVKNNKLILRP